MKKRIKLRIVAALLLAAFIITWEQESLYEISLAASYGTGADKVNESEETKPVTNSGIPEENSTTEAVQEEKEKTEETEETSTSVSENLPEEDVSEEDSLEDHDRNLEDEKKPAADMMEETDKETEAEQFDEMDTLLAEEEEIVRTGAVELGEAHIPATFAELQAMDASNPSREYNISTYQDWLNLQAISQESSLEGYSFTVESNYSKGEGSDEFDTYDFRLLNNDPYKFTGIGGESTPFKGRLKSFNANLLKFYMKTPLFQYLSPEAEIAHFNLICTNSTAGLANVLKGSGTLSLENILITGTIVNSSGNAGGLFASIENTEETPLLLNIKKNGITNIGIALGGSVMDTTGSTSLSVSGMNCGGIAGSIQGKVSIVYDTDLIYVKNLSVTGTANGGQAGMLIGLMDGLTAQNASLSFAKDTTILLKVTGKGNNGGIIGKAVHASISTGGFQLTLLGVGKAGTTDVYGSSGDVNTGGVGGAIGWLSESVITDDSHILIKDAYVGSLNTGSTGCLFGLLENSVLGNITEDGKGFEVQNCEAYGNGGFWTGAFAGTYISNGIENTISHVKVSNLWIQSSKSGGSAGGLIGYVSLQNNTALTIKDWSVHGLCSTAHLGKGTGGVIGKTEGGTLKLENGMLIIGKNTNLASNYVSTYRIWDENVQSTIGGVIGKSVDSDCEMKNLNITMGYMNSYGASGGILGATENTEKHHIYLTDITMTGTMYMEKNNMYKAGMIGKVGANTIVKMDGTIDLSALSWTGNTGIYNGQIAGIQEKALIYLEEGATYKTCTGNYIKGIDYVGNFGGFYRNGSWGEGNKLIENDTVNGIVPVVGDTYQFDSVADILRLSIALNSEGTFATNCFQNQTYEELLSGKYKLAANTYDLTETGMVTMQRNYGAGTSLTAVPAMFTGSFCGESASNKAVILHSENMFQQLNLGLFAHVGSLEDGKSAEFRYLSIQEELTNKTAISSGFMGGLSTYAQGNVTVEDCDVDIDITAQYNSSNQIGYYGGVFGKYTTCNGSKLQVSNVTAAGTKTTKDKDHFSAQVIGYVEYPNATYAELPELNFSNITITGTVKNIQNEARAMIGGFIAMINQGNYGNSYSEYTSYTKKACMNVENLTVSGLTVNSGTGVSTVISGGLLGFRYTDTEITMKHIRVTDDLGTNTLTTRGRFGGLVYAVTGRMDMEDIQIADLSVTNNGNADSGLLVGEGRYLYLSVKDYHIDSDTTKISGIGSQFDELVGVNQISESQGGIVSISDSTGKPYLKVNDSENPYKSYENQANYGSKTAASVQNPDTRYYYNLPEIKSRTSLDYSINSEDELMLWHLVQYATPVLKNFFLQDGENYNNFLNKSYTIHSDTGILDLNGYSYYPTTISGCTIASDNQTKIVFYGNELIGKEQEATRQKQPYTIEKQHYMLHSGLFNQVAASTVSGLTLGGTVSKVSGTSGALVSGQILGVPVVTGDADDKLGYTYSTTAETSFQNILLDNVWVSGNTDEQWNGPYGLMVANISAGAKVKLDRIQMVNYNPSASPTGYQKAASALIGLVGSEDGNENDKMIEIHVTFTNMDIADIKDNITVPNTGVADLKNSTDADKVLAKASFIYEYQYYEDTCWGLYTFYKADYLKGKGITPLPADSGISLDGSAGLVTMGEEIGDTVEYYDANLTTPIMNDSYGFDYANYKPYVWNWQEREIAVNPKPGDITKGCGTYEDPYQIENERQLKSLYYYLKNNTGQLANWKVNAIGNDTVFCSKSAHDIKTYNVNADFPTREQMNQAYYLITADIDFSTFYDFVGFGNRTEPFLGVFAGTSTLGMNPVIKLPNQSANNVELDSYAFIRYAKGCVIKDITIQLGEITVTDGEGNPQKDYIKVKEAGAGVIAYVRGGDNIIDGVTVKGTLKAASTKANIGGYVGNVSLGSVILRNMEQESLKEFVITDKDLNSLSGSQEYLWTGGIAGRVLDGLLVYEGLGTGTSNEKVLSASLSSIYENDSGLEASPTFAILNGAYLDVCGKVKAEVSDTAGSEKFVLNVANEGQFLMAALALNTGCLTYNGASTETVLGYQVGYGADSRCRSGSYDSIGTSDSSNTEYLDVVKNDNLNGGQLHAAQSFFHPYLFQYFELPEDFIFGTITETADSYQNVKSIYMDLNANAVTMNFLTGGSFDMAQFGNSFRGVGAGYFTNTNTFMGNIFGNNNTVNVELLADARLDLYNVALFNTVYIKKQSDSCQVKDITVTGKIVNNSLSGTDEADMQYGDSVEGKSAAGLIASLQVAGNLNGSNYSQAANYYFNNVTVKDMTIRSLEYGGGIIGNLKSITVSNQNNNSYKFVNCKVGAITSGEADSDYNVSITASGDTGGIVAAYLDVLTTTFENCQVQSASMEAKGILKYWNGVNIRSSFATAGGFAGRAVGSGKTITISGGSYEKVSLKAQGHMGGIIGVTAGKIDLNTDGSSFKGTKIRFEGTGTAALRNFSSTTAENSNAESRERTWYLGNFGGLFGYVGSKAQIYHAEVSDIQGRIAEGVSDKTFMAGLVGTLYDEGTIKNCTVGNDSTNISMTSETDIAHISTNRISGAGMVGWARTVVSLTDCHVRGMSVANPGIIQGTDTGAGMLVVSNSHSYYKDCTVKNLAIKGNARAAGVEGKTTTNVNSIFENVIVSDCALWNLDLLSATDTVASGGMVAITYGTANFVDCQVERLIMKGITVSAAGGFVGYAIGNNGTVQVAVKDNDKSSVKDSVIMGIYAGGIVGRMAKYGTGTAKNYRISDVAIESNKIIGFTNNDSSVLYAGGIVGAEENGNNVLYGNHIKIWKNLIGTVHTNASGITANKAYVGGISGSYKGDMYFQNVEMEDNMISILDGEKIKADTPFGGSSVTRADMADYMSASTFGIWDDLGNVTAEKAEKVYPRMLNWKNNKLEEYPDSMTEEEMKNYTKKAGMLFGNYNSVKEAYVTELAVSYKEELRKYRPVLDVASDGNVSSLSDMYKYRQYYHIVYGPYEKEKTASTILNNSIGSVVTGAGKSGAYNFGALKDIWDDYQDDNQDRKYNYRLFENYNQIDNEGNPVTFQQVYDSTYYNETEGYLTPFEDSMGNPIPMLVFDNSELNQIVNAVANMLTNNGGAIGENQYKAAVVKVTPEKMKVENGTVFYDTTGKPSVKADSGYQKEVKLSVNSAGYDTCQDEKNGTFTMLHIEYCWTNPVTSMKYGIASSDTVTLAKTQMMTIDIPIFIKKILEVETHIVGMEGAEYLIDNILSKGNGNLTLLRGIYTAYIEYDYNDANTEYSEKLNKEIYFKQYGTDASVPIFKNTKMTLIDMRDNNHVYYFKAEEDRGKVSFSEFQDSEGNPYTEKAIRNIPYLTDKEKTLYKKHYASEKGEVYDDTANVAVQQYLLLIDSSEMEQNSDDGLSYTYTVNAAPDESCDELLKKCKYSWPPLCNLLVTEINGIQGEFLENTSAIGEISEDSNGLAIEYEYKISAQNAYWTFKKSTAGKAIEEYIDIAIYLKDADGNRVNMPPGTLVTFNKNSGTPSSTVMQGGSILYNYKDAGNVFNLNSITQNSVISGTIDFDFTSADFTDFQEGSYTIYMELLKTRDKDFPMGGENLDTFSGELYSDTVRRLGFVVEAEELMTLGMNGYLSEESDKGIIDYTMNIDFTDYVPKTEFSNKTEFEELARKYFTVDFTILKKKKNPNGTFTYEDYNGGDVEVYWGKSDTALSNGQSGKTVVFRFDNERMKSGNRGQDDHVVTYPYTLKVNVENLLKNNDSITNYKVLAKLYVTDVPPEGAEDIQYDQVRFVNTPPVADALEDYFIFTIAKLKTDLDIANE